MLLGVTRVAALVPDLFFASKVDATLRAAGHDVTIASSPAEVPGDAEVLIVDLDAPDALTVAATGAAARLLLARRRGHAPSCREGRVRARRAALAHGKGHAGAGGAARGRVGSPRARPRSQEARVARRGARGRGAARAVARPTARSASMSAPRGSTSPTWSRGSGLYPGCAEAARGDGLRGGGRGGVRRAARRLSAGAAGDRGDAVRRLRGARDGERGERAAAARGHELRGGRRAAGQLRHRLRARSC